MLQAAELRNQRLPRSGGACQHKVFAFQRSCSYGFFLRRVQLADSALKNYFFELLRDWEFSYLHFYAPSLFFAFSENMATR
jgi:hypothetical protein